MLDKERCGAHSLSEIQLAHNIAETKGECISEQGLNFEHGSSALARWRAGCNLVLESHFHRFLARVGQMCSTGSESVKA